MRISALSLFFWVALAAAQTYPAKPVRIIVATGPGGGDDFVARQVGNKVGEILGQQFIVENRPGAGGMIGQTYVSKAPADGYTLLLAGGSMAGARFVNANMGYDLKRDFTPISLVETSAFVLVANPAQPAKTAAEFIQLGRSRPGKLTYGTLGAGQMPYWNAVLFNSMARIEAVEVQYKSAADVILDIIAGRLDYAFVPLTNAVGNREKLRSLGVTTSTRAELLADVPALGEAALPGYDLPTFRSIMGPAGLSPQVVSTLNDAIARAISSADLRERLSKAGSTPMASSPDELRQRFEHLAAIFGKVAAEIRLQPQ